VQSNVEGGDNVKATLLRAMRREVMAVASVGDGAGA
jgi:hypothetical protein